MTHPSGRPVRVRIVKSHSQPRGTLDGYMVAKLNAEEPNRTDLGSYVGFIHPAQLEEFAGMWANKKPNVLN